MSSARQCNGVRVALTEVFCDDPELEWKYERTDLHITRVNRALCRANDILSAGPICSLIN